MSTTPVSRHLAMCSRILAASQIGLLPFILAPLTGCNGRPASESTTVVVDERGTTFAERPTVRAACRALHEGAMDTAYCYGMFLEECGDLDGDGLAEVAAMYALSAEPDLCKVDLISFGGQRVIKSIEVDECDFVEGGAHVADVNADGKCELIVVSPSSTGAINGWMPTSMARQNVQVYSLETAERIISSELGEADPYVNNIRIVGLIDDLDSDGIRECVVNYSLDRTVVMSLPRHRTIYEVRSPLVRETRSSAEQRLEPRGITCGDVDSDNVADFVICYPALGTCDVHSGVDGHRIRTLASGSQNLKGAALHYTCDLLGPGRPGLLVGSPNEGRGVVRIFDLQSGQKALEWSSGDSYYDVGSAVATLHDMDGDGVPEALMAGERETSFDRAERAGIVLALLSGDRDAPVVLSTSNPRARFGSAMCSIGTLGREGQENLVVGEPGRLGAHPTAFYSGSAWLLVCGKLMR